MGMDLLDISFRVEKTFKVAVAPSDVVALAHEQDVLVGDLYILILKKTRLWEIARHDLRLNYALWANVQAAIHDATSVPLESVELKTRLDSLFPRADRRTTWEALRNAAPYEIAELEYPRGVRECGLLLAAMMVLVEQFRLWQWPGAIWLWPLLGILGLWMLFETYLKMLSALAPLRKRFPSRMRTVKDLCRTILAANYEQLCPDQQIPLDEGCLVVWQQLTGILADTLGPREVTFRSRLVQDLGMD